MYARLVILKSSPENRSAIESMADELAGFTAGLEGYIQVTYLVNDDDTSYASLSVWQTREQAEAAGAAVMAQFGEQMASFSTVPPVIEVYEVYDPS